MKEQLFQYINEKFPNLSHDIHLRFELGEPHENGTDERIQQVVYRVTALFEHVFDPDDFVYLYIEDWESEDIMFGNTTPNYIYELLSDHQFEEQTVVDVEEDEDPLGNPIQVVNERKLKITYSQIRSIPYQKILEGIAHYEQGREPKIGQRVHFICPEKDIVFLMYDDRGCILYSDSTDKLRSMYVKYNDWIVDYWRERIDSIFSPSKQ